MIYIIKKKKFFT